MSSAEELAGIADSLDLENSDDLNKIIQKYETMLGGSASKDQGHSKAPTPLPQMLQTKSSKVQQIATLKAKLEESWGTQERL